MYQENNVGNTEKAILAARGLRISDGASLCPILKSRGPVRIISDFRALELERDSQQVLDRQRERREALLERERRRILGDC